MDVNQTLIHEMKMPSKSTKAEVQNNEAPLATTAPQHSQNNLYMTIKTFNAEGKDIGFRVVDLFHYNTRNWLQGHIWWAMHNGNLVEIDIAKPDEIEAYLEAGKAALAEKFNSAPAAQEPIAA